MKRIVFLFCMIASLAINAQSVQFLPETELIGTWSQESISGNFDWGDREDNIEKIVFENRTVTVTLDHGNQYTYSNWFLGNCNQALHLYGLQRSSWGTGDMRYSNMDFRVYYLDYNNNMTLRSRDGTAEVILTKSSSDNGINNINKDTSFSNSNEKLYNLNGQQISSPRNNDIYIKNGNKFINK